MADRASGPVLLVEDDEPLVAILVKHLEAHGLAARAASSAEAAVQLLETGLRPALVLLDINLPGDTGWSFIRSDAYVAAGSPRVVVVSATRIPSSRLREYGVSGYLPKPFAIDTLVETVKRYAIDGSARPVTETLEEPVDVERS